MVAKTGRARAGRSRRGGRGGGRWARGGAAAGWGGGPPWPPRPPGDVVDPREHPWGHPRGNAVYRARDLLVKVAAEDCGHQRRTHHGREPVAIVEPDTLLDLHSEVDRR